MANGSVDLSDRTVLVTGGTGSFGHAVVRRLLAGNCREVRILSRDEAKQYAMRLNAADPRLSFYLGDVRDRGSVDDAMKGADLVFHAAALKQVPNCENFPDQAVMTNFTGSVNVIRSAIASGVRRVVCLSTDKAVYPVNAMGMSKALMEKQVQAESRRLWKDGRTVLCVVRYGNVLCSRGSVVPVFIEQIASGRPVTITVPGMTRFLLRLADAVDLVERALSFGEPGDIFVRKSPACDVATLAAATQHLLGADEPLRVVGARPGEKMHETLATAEEMRVACDLGDTWRIPANTSDLIDPVPSLRAPYAGSDYTSASTEQLDVRAVAALLSGLPEVKAAMAAHGRRGVPNAARARRRLQLV